MKQKPDVLSLSTKIDLAFGDCSCPRKFWFYFAARTWGLTLSSPSLAQPVQTTATVLVIATPELLSIDTASRYGDYVDDILQAVKVGQMSKAEAIGKLESADRYLTRPEMTARLYPPGGLRDQVTRTFGYIYYIDRKEAEGDTPTNFKNANQYSDRLDMITDSYQSGKITKTEALTMIGDANTHATKGLEQQLFPPQGTREKMARIFGYLYETTDPNEKIKNMLPEATMWPEQVSANLLFTQSDALALFSPLRSLEAIPQRMPHNAYAQSVFSLKAFQWKVLS